MSGYKDAWDERYPEKVGVVCYTEGTSREWKGVRPTAHTKLSDFFKALIAGGWQIDLLDEVEITLEGVDTKMDGTQFTMTRGRHGEYRTVWTMSRDEYAMLLAANQDSHPRIKTGASNADSDTPSR